VATAISVLRILLFACCSTAALLSKKILFGLEDRTAFFAKRLSSSAGFTDVASDGEALSSAIRDVVNYLSGPLTAILILLGLLFVLGPPLLSRVLKKRVLSPPDSTSDRVFLAAVFLVCLGLGLSLNASVFRDYRITPDENNYLDQARIFAEGRITGEAPALPGFFDEPYLAHKDGRLFIIFQPGWPLLLAPAVSLGMQRAMPALTGVLALLAVFLLAGRLAGRGVARGSVLIMLLSPYFLFYAGTYYAHIASLMWISFFVLFFVVAREEKRGLFYLLAGGCLGAAAITRYFDLLFGFPFGLLLVWDLVRRRQGGWRNILLFCLPLLASGCLAILYESLCTGRLFLPPYMVYYHQARYLFFLSQFKGPVHLFGFSSDYTVWMAVKIILARILALNLWIFPLALLFLFPALLRPVRWTWLFLSGSFCLVLVYFLYVPPGGWEYGPRYYFPVYGCLAILLAAGIQRSFSYIRKRWGEQRIFRGLAYWLLFCMFINICLTVSTGAYLRRWIFAMTDHQRLLQEHGIREGIVFITTKPDFFAPRFEDKESRERLGREVPFYLIRNGMDFRRPLLFAHSLGKEEDRQLISRFPDRTFYQVEADPFAAFWGLGRGALRRLER